MCMRIFFTLWASLLLVGCAFKKPDISNPYLIVFKTPQWRFADTGYIRTGSDVAEIEVFEAGHRLLRLQIENRVCVEGEGCMSKSGFNEAYLSPDYPDDFFFHLLRGEPIHGGRDLHETETGFEQHVDGLLYRVSPKQIYFKDTNRGILIKFKRL